MINSNASTNAVASKHQHRLLPLVGLILAAGALLLTSLDVHAQDDSPQVAFSYTACSNITSEHLTTLQLYQRGITLDQALALLPQSNRATAQRVRYIFSLAREQGILNTYSDINTNYARCATLVHRQQGIPAMDHAEFGYYYCAGENKRRFEIILHLDQNHNLERVLALTPSSHHHVAKQYSRLVDQQGLLAAFDLTANNLKACLKNLAP